MEWFNIRHLRIQKKKHLHETSCIFGCKTNLTNSVICKANIDVFLSFWFSFKVRIPLWVEIISFQLLLSWQNPVSVLCLRFVFWSLWRRHITPYFLTNFLRSCWNVRQSLVKIPQEYSTKTAVPMYPYLDWNRRIELTLDSYFFFNFV